MKQEHLARLLGTTQSSVSGWVHGKYEPAATTIFRIERALALEPGHLSRPLGYLPVDTPAGAVSVEAAILQSPLLDDDAKSALLGLYRVLTDRSVSAGARAPVAQKAVSPTRTRLAAAPAGVGGPRSVAGSR